MANADRRYRSLAPHRRAAGAPPPPAADERVSGRDRKPGSDIVDQAERIRGVIGAVCIVLTLIALDLLITVLR